MILRWFRRCEHLNVRCVHGDEIIWNRYRRGVCLDCNRSLRDMRVVRRAAPAHGHRAVTVDR